MAQKRTGRGRGRPPGGSAAIVRAILATTLKQLEVAGFAQLCVEDIARAVGVNKTSIYRRWPSKADLVFAAVLAAPETEHASRETGDLRRDLVRLLKAKARLLATPAGTRIAHALVTLDGGDRADLTQAMNQRRYAEPRAVLENAIARGALPPNTDADLVSELLVAPLVNRVFVRNEPVPESFIVRVVDHVLRGAGVTVSRRRSPS
jgi:AcrR family transcriptional regulator